jgi:hypothetical protein
MCHRRQIAIALMVLAAMCRFAPVDASVEGAPDARSAKGGDQYAVDRWTVDGGGSRSSGGSFTIGGTIAQPDSDPLQPSTGGAYAITGGFWPGLTPDVPTVALFADGFETP